MLHQTVIGWSLGANLPGKAFWFSKAVFMDFLNGQCSKQTSVPSIVVRYCGEKVKYELTIWITGWT